MFCCCCGRCCRDPNQKFTPVRQKRLFGLAFATINFWIVRSLITWSIITIMIQCFLHFREKQRWTNSRRKIEKKKLVGNTIKRNLSRFNQTSGHSPAYFASTRVSHAVAFQMCVALLNLVGPFAPKLLFNYDICLLFHLMCGFFGCSCSSSHHLTHSPMAIVRQFETTWNYLSLLNFHNRFIQDVNPLISCFQLESFFDFDYNCPRQTRRDNQVAVAQTLANLAILSGFFGLSSSFIDTPNQQQRTTITTRFESCVLSSRELHKPFTCPFFFFGVCPICISLMSEKTFTFDLWSQH